MARGYRFARWPGGLLLPILVALNGVDASAPPSARAGVQAADVGPYFHDTFNHSGTLHEAPRMVDSASPYWWLSSGAVLRQARNVAWTNQQELSGSHPWRTYYARTNPGDTDDGYHPQNIFRLVTRSRWHDFIQEVFFLLSGPNMSSSPNRGAWNGIYLLARYQSSQTMYAAGLRVDGAAAIKKKVGGHYSLLALEDVFGDRHRYDKWSRANLLPHRGWVGQRMIVRDEGDSVRIWLYAKIHGFDDRWRLVASATDTPDDAHGPPIRNVGFAGIRSDFMDIRFEDFRAWESP